MMQVTTSSWHDFLLLETHGGTAVSLELLKLVSQNSVPLLEMEVRNEASDI